MNSRRAVAQCLRHLAGLGVTHIPRVNLPKPSEPVRRGAEAASRAEVAGPAGSSVRPATAAIRSREPAGEPTGRSHRSEISPSLPLPSRLQNPLISAVELERQSAVCSETHPEVQAILSRSFSRTAPSAAVEKSEAMCQLAGIVSQCVRCSELARLRTQTVFGVGDPNARIMFIGEAPGADEDARGEPFVGAAGKLLNKIIESCQLKREELYICNILKCRPPGNRNPLPQEAANCREHLEAQIHVVQPEYIVCWGTVAAQNLLGVTRPIGKLRGEFQDYKGTPVLCTYHPSYLLRNPAAKVQVWDDMKWFMQHLGVNLT